MKHTVTLSYGLALELRDLLEQTERDIETIGKIRALVASLERSARTAPDVRRVRRQFLEAIGECEEPTPSPIRRDTVRGMRAVRPEES